MEYQIGTAQGAGGTHVDIRNGGSGNNVHVVPNGETHEVTVVAMSDTSGTVTTKIKGETNGVIEAVTANEQRIVFTGIVVGTSGGSAVHCLASAGTVASARAKVKKIS